MLKLVAIVRPQRAQALCTRLDQGGWVQDLGAAEVLGSNREVAKAIAAPFAIEALPMVQIEGLVDEVDADAVIEAVLATCRTGRGGDGKVFFLGVEQIAG